MNQKEIEEWGGHNSLKETWPEIKTAQEST